MPLEHNSSKPAFKRNVSTLMGEVGKSPHVKSRDQALAIAFAIKRRKRAFGGLMQRPAGWQVRNEARGLMHTGPINSFVPGRTDKHNMNVPGGAYVLPSETISHLGQNNTAAGQAMANAMFGKSGPYGVGHVAMRAGPGAPRGRKHFAEGGATHDGAGEPTPVVTAGGEYVIDPMVVRNIGNGDLTLGHKILDHWVMQTRKDHIKTLRKLKPPAKS